MGPVLPPRADEFPSIRTFNPSMLSLEGPKHEIETKKFGQKIKFVPACWC